MLCQKAPGKQGLLPHPSLQASRQQRCILGLFSSRQKWSLLRKTLKAKLLGIQELNTKGEDRETCTKEQAQTEWEHHPVTTAFPHIGYMCIGFCFSSRHSALGGETADAPGCNGPSSFQLVRYQLRDICKHHIALATRTCKSS